MKVYRDPFDYFIIWLKIVAGCMIYVVAGFVLISIGGLVDRYTPDWVHVLYVLFTVTGFVVAAIFTILYWSEKGLEQ